MKNDYEIAEKYFNSESFLNAFESFKKVTLSKTSSKQDKSDAFNMMGAIVLIDTRVKNNDESGLEYFIQSLNLNPYNIGALLNVIEGFGSSFNNHQNVEMLNFSVQKLKEIDYKFSPTEKMMLNSKLQLAKEMFP